jgi:hypothetical protein
VNAATASEPASAPIRGSLSVSVPALYDVRERRILASLAERDAWVRPMDVGGYNSSNHNYRLTKLVRFGLVERRYRTSFSRRNYRNRVGATFEYRITEAGKAYING